MPVRILLGAVLALAGSAALPQAQEYTVFTYNIRYDNPADGPDRWDRRKDAVAAVVLDHHPAIIGIQEALAHQVDYLDKHWPGYRRCGVGRDDGSAAGEFAPVYFDTTVFRLIEGRTIWLSETPDRPSVGWDASCARIATLAVLADRAKGDSIRVVNTHWDHIGRNARRFSAFMMKGIQSDWMSEGRPALVLGDLNATPLSEPIAIMDQWFEEACPDSTGSEATFNGFRPDEEAKDRIDYIWLSPSRWKVLEYDVLRPKSHGRQASDHFVVMARLTLLPRAWTDR